VREHASRSRFVLTAGIVLALLALAIVAFAVLQYGWIARFADADRTRFREQTWQAARACVNEFDAELRRAASEGESSPLVRETYTLDPRAATLRDSNGAPAPWPADLRDLRVFFERPTGGPPPVLSTPVIIGPRHDDGARELIVFDDRQIRESLLPRLLARHFGEQHTVIVRHRGTVLVGARNLADPEVVAYLFPPRSMMGRGGRRVPWNRDELPSFGGEGTARPVPWELAISRNHDAVESAIGDMRRRNLFVASAIVAVVIAAAIVLLLMVRRSREEVRQQLAFVAGVSHELNTPVAAVRSAAQNLADNIVQDPEEVAQYGNMIVRESRRLSKVVSQVLDYSVMQRRAPQWNVESVDVAGVIDDVLAGCRWMIEEQDVTVDVSVAEDLPPILADADALRRAIGNLVTNAIKYGGEARWVGIRAAADGGELEIAVEDRGPGIAPSDLPRIFEPFHRGPADTTGIPGAGLGLALAREIVEALDGTIRVAKRPEGGTAFTIRLRHA